MDVVQINGRLHAVLSIEWPGGFAKTEPLGDTLARHLFVQDADEIRTLGDALVDAGWEPAPSLAIRPCAACGLDLTPTQAELEALYRFGNPLRRPPCLETDDGLHRYNGHAGELAVLDEAPLDVPRAPHDLGNPETRGYGWRRRRATW